MRNNTFFWLTFFTLQTVLLLLKATLLPDISWWWVLSLIWVPVMVLVACLVLIVLMFSEKTPEQLEEEDAENTNYKRINDL
jgi:Ca2+/Na+ antiporter